MPNSPHSNRWLADALGTRTGRWNAGHNAAASHWSPSFILGAMLSKVVSHQRLERPNGVSHLPRTPTRFATRICNKPGHSDVTNAHRVIPNRCCASPMRDCIPNIAQRASCTIRSRRPSIIIALEGWNRPACFSGCSACYCAQQSAHWIQKVRIAVGALRAPTARAARAACPLLRYRQHLLKRREAIPAPKP